MRRALFQTLGLAALAASCTQSPPPPSSSATHSAAVAAQPKPEPAVAAAAPNPAPALTRVDPSLVCMVNDQFMGRPQIPVTVNGSTYYGCCEMCKGKLANDPSARTAVDPVSGRTVDKAAAIIGKTQNGSTVYFENEQTFAAYSPRSGG